MMLNLFTHDFLHDFNASKFAERLSKISSIIDKLRYEIDSRVINKKAPTEKVDVEETVPPEKVASEVEETVPPEKVASEVEENIEPDETIESIKLNEYECFGENETGTLLNYLIENINETAPEEQKINVTDENIEKIKQILTIEGSITRSRAKLLQWAKNFVDETKLYVLGLFNLKKINDFKLFGGRVNKKSPSHRSYKINNSHTKKINSPYKKNNSNTKKQLPNYYFPPQPPSDIKFENIVENNIEINQTDMKRNFNMLRNYVVNGIESAMYYSKDYKELSDYFQFFGKLYLYYENENMSPLDTFNLSLIEDILVLYLLDKEKIFLNDKNLYSILDKYNKLFKNSELKNSFVYKFHGKNTSGKQLGGTLEDDIGEIDQIVQDINTTFPEFFTSEYNKNNEMDLDEIYEKTILYANSIINNLNIKKIKINSYIVTINNSKEQYENSRPRSKESNKYLYIDSMYKLLIYIRQSFIDKKIALNAKLTKDNESNREKKLTTTQSSDVQRISIAVAQGGLNYIISENYKKEYNKKTDKKTDKKNDKSMLDYEYDIIKDIVEKKKGFTILDTKIRENFHTYAENSGNLIETKNELSQLIDNNKKKNMRITAINNAATSTLKEILGNNFNKEVICPTSSYVDAMGSLGSCSGEEFKKHPKEFFDMDFIIRHNNDNGDFYQGNTVIKEYNGSREVKITYTATCNEFILPYVEITIDMTTSKVVTLTANNTFKNVINKILTIWGTELSNNMFKDEEILWQLLENKRIYIDLISTGSLKGIGDFFQEINSTLENGGYREIMIKYFENHLRIGANGDQPSGIRAGFLLLNASRGIHENAVAGYLADDDDTIVMISRQPIIKGGSRKKKLSKKQNRKTRKKSI